jgi:hypothetical protein
LEELVGEGLAIGDADFFAVAQAGAEAFVEVDGGVEEVGCLSWVFGQVEFA